jgi:hypothetical protein
MLIRSLAALASALLIVPASALAAGPDFTLLERNLPAASDEVKVPAQAVGRKAVLSLSLSSLDEEGLVLDLALDPKGVPVNAVAAVLTYPADKLEFLGFDEDAAEFSFYLERDADEPGRISISALQPSPGVRERATVARLKFRQKDDRPALVMCEAGSMALANDGYGTSVLRYRTGILIAPAEDRP